MSLGPSSFFWRMRRLGWPFHLGLVLLLSALFLEVLAIGPAREELAELTREMAGRSRPAALESQAGLRLPPEKELPDMIRTVMEGAQENGIMLERAEYQQLREGTRVRCRMILPVRGSWPQMRAWLAGVLAALPTASLDEIGLHRDAAAEDVLSGRVRLSITMEAGR